jgi:phosphatidylinositol phospholipase C delta
MEETWGDKLVVGRIEGVPDGMVTPGHLRGRIVVMVEYYPPAVMKGEQGSGEGSGEEMSRWKGRRSRRMKRKG